MLVLNQMAGVFAKTTGISTGAAATKRESSSASTRPAPNRSKQRGGARVGAGRKKSRELRFDPSHMRRPELSYKHPVHVMLRTLPSVPRLRQRGGFDAIRTALLHFVDGADFRVIHISIQRNHLHLIVEASNKRALGRGMQRFAIRAARALNSEFERDGKVFAFRYHAKHITSARYARNAISYVLNNWRRHRADQFNSEMSMPFDRFSSASMFMGWAASCPYKPSGEGLPISIPRTQLLVFDWEWFGLIDPYEVPGPMEELLD